MSERTPRLERFLEGAARLASGGGLHPLLVLQEVQTAAQESIRDGMMANGYRIELAEADLEALGGGAVQLRDAVRRSLDDIRGSRDVRLLAPWQIEFVAGTQRPGTLHVEASYRNVPPPPSNRPDPGATQVVTRHRNLRLQVEGHGSAPLSHTPFTIGREKGCDLVIMDLSVSRRHARIETGPGGTLVIRDLGSRNKLLVDGEQRDEVALAPGVRITLGGTTIWLEEAE